MTYPIYELPVYDGRTKVYRVLNLSTGTVYSPSYETLTEAIASIEAGQRRGDGIVVAVTLDIIISSLNTRS